MTRSSPHLAIWTARVVGAITLLAGIWPGLLGAQVMPDLTRYNADTRLSLELACIREKSKGPSNYHSCLHAHLRSIGVEPRVASPQYPSTPSATRPAPSEFVEERPPVSRGELYSTPQLRYCLAESIRIEAVREVLDKSGPRSVEEFNARIEDFNARCSRYRFYESEMFIVKDEVERHRTRLQADARRAYLNSMAARNPARATTPESAAPKPEHEAAPAVPSIPSPSPDPRRAQPDTPSDPAWRGSSRLLAWTDFTRPPMPFEESGVSLSPQGVFNRAAPSVYVLLSAPSVESLRAASNVSQGSAVAITPTVAVTNCHVIRGNRVHFLVKDRSAYYVTTVHGDTESDRCALTVDSAGLTPISAVRRFTTLAIGERVYTIGSPKGLEGSLAEGIISGLREHRGVDVVQTTAPISPGSSGGGLFDSAGNLIGITTFLLRDTQSLNFAIAADAYWR